MPWKQTQNAAMYGGVAWPGLVRVAHVSSPQQAMRAAMRDRDITFFFYCREMLLLGNPPVLYYPGDAVFFTGEPQPGSAPQCDLYQKTGMSIAYVNDATPDNVAAAGDYVTAQNLPAIDVVSIFAANINLKPVGDAVRLAPDVDVPSGDALACGNPNIVQVLKSNTIASLQSLGITVLLSFLNNGDDSGWSEFTDEDDAQLFTQQLQSVVEQYGLDGIDIDDEYSAGKPNHTSLPMVTSLMRQAMKEIIISKALWADLGDFGVPWKGVTLEQTMTYGWEMTYGAPPQQVLPPYVKLGLPANALSKGYSSKLPPSDPEAEVAWMKAHGYEGVMAYAFEAAANTTLLGELVDYWCGPGNWNQRPSGAPSRTSAAPSMASIAASR